MHQQHLLINKTDDNCLAANDTDSHLEVCLFLYIIFRNKWVQNSTLIQFDGAAAHISWNIFFFYLFFYLRFHIWHWKKLNSYAAQQIRLTSSKLLGIDPWLCSKSRLEIPREKANKSRAIKMLLSELRKVLALWSVHTVFLLCASKH